MTVQKTNNEERGLLVLPSSAGARFTSLIILVSSFSLFLGSYKAIQLQGKGSGLLLLRKDKGEGLEDSNLMNDYAKLQLHLQEQRKMMEDRVKEGYSHFYKDLFYAKGDNETRTSRGKLAYFNPDQPQGWEALKSKLKLKILSVQERQLFPKKILKEVGDPHRKRTKPPVRWVQAIAGHSNAAGHGNFLEESYGAVMDAAISPMLQSIGIELETRVYGMSGQKSAPEMALCQEAIVGTDVDLLTWDYALTDNKVAWMFSFWMQRASLLRSQPVILGNYLDFKYDEAIADLYTTHPDLPFMAMQESVIQDVENAVPDSLEVFDLPPLLEFFRCSSPFLEVNDLCKDHKFKRDVCLDRYWMVSWHLGFKRLALIGNLLALFLADALQEAVDELLEEMPKGPVKFTDVQGRMTELRQETKQQWERIQSANFQPHLGEVDQKGLKDKKYQDLASSWIYQSQALCRTFRLPSQQRYKQISTGHPVVNYGLDPEEGLEHGNIVARWGNFTNNVTVDNALPFELGYDERVRHSQRGCNRTTNIDFADYLYVTDTWRKAILPSPAEAQDYFPEGEGGHKFHGVIIICPFICKLQSQACSGDEIIDDWDIIDIQVNGLKALTVDFLLNRENCVVLKHSEGKDTGDKRKQEENPKKSENNFVFPANDDGKYDLRMRVNPTKAKEPGILQVSSIILI